MIAGGRGMLYPNKDDSKENVGLLQYISSFADTLPIRVAVATGGHTRKPILSISFVSNDFGALFGTFSYCNICSLFVL